jgi:hypothetical protein
MNNVVDGVHLLEGLWMAIVVMGQEWKGVELEVTEEERLRVPSEFWKAVLLERYWLRSGFVGIWKKPVQPVGRKSMKIYSSRFPDTLK